MTSGTYCKYIILLIVLTMSFSCVSSAQIFQMANSIRRIPENYPNKVTPDFNEKRLSYGINLGLNTTTFTSSLRDDLSPAMGVNFGFEISFLNIYAYLDAGFSFGKIRQDFDAQGIWSNSKPFCYGKTDISFGYAFFDRMSWKTCPFIGYSISEISTVKTTYGEDRIALSKFSPVAGIAADYKLIGDIFIMPVSHRQDYLEINVKSKLYVSYHAYDDNAKGYSINLMIGMSLIKRPLKIK